MKDKYVCLCQGSNLHNQLAKKTTKRLQKLVRFGDYNTLIDELTNY